MKFLYKPTCEYDATFKFPPFVYLSAIGLWPGHVCKNIFWSRVWHKVYILWFWINLGSVLFVVIAELRYLYENIKDLTKAVENLCTSVIGLLVTMRFIHIRYNSNKLKRIMETFTKEIWINRRIHSRIFERCIGQTKPTTILSLPMLTVLIIYTLRPIIGFFTGATTMMSTDKQLPYSTIFPYDYQPYWIYIFTFALCLHGGIVTVSLSYALDVLFIYFVAFLCGQFEILQENILRLIPECHTEWKLNETRRNIAVLDVEELQLRYTRRLIKIARRHKVLLSYAKELDQFFSFPLALNFFVSTFLTCFLGFQFLVNEKNSVHDFLRTFLYLSSIIGQLYILCNLGSLLISKSKNTAIYLYICNWEGGYLSKNSPLILKPVDMDLKELNSNLPSWKNIRYYPTNQDFRDKLRFMIMRSHRPIDLKAMHYMVLSLETFSRILSSSLSFFTLLKTFLDKQNNETI